MPFNWSDMPPLSALRAFEAAARLGGFSAAARALNVTPAAISQQVRGLEDHLAVALMQRDGRAIALTAEGQRLAAALAEGFGTIHAGLAAVTSGRADAPVRITLNASFAAHWLMPRLRDFWARHPEIALSLHPDPQAVDLRREGMDVALRYGRGHWPGLVAHRLASARLVVVAAPSLVGAQGAADLSRLPWVLTSDWPELDNWLQSRGLDAAQLDCTWFTDDDLTLAAARQGLGVTVESHALVEGDIAAGRLIALQEEQDDAPAYFVVTLPGPSRPPVRTFLTWLSKQG